MKTQLICIITTSLVTLSLVWADNPPEGGDLIEVLDSRPSIPEEVEVTLDEPVCPGDEIDLSGYVEYVEGSFRITDEATKEEDCGSGSIPVSIPHDLVPILKVPDDADAAKDASPMAVDTDWYWEFEDGCDGLIEDDGLQTLIVTYFLPESAAEAVSSDDYDASCLKLPFNVKTGHSEENKCANEEFEWSDSEGKITFGSNPAEESEVDIDQPFVKPGESREVDIKAKYIGPGCVDPKEADPLEIQLVELDFYANETKEENDDVIFTYLSSEAQSAAEKEVLYWVPVQIITSQDCELELKFEANNLYFYKGDDPNETDTDPSLENTLEESFNDGDIIYIGTKEIGAGSQSYTVQGDLGTGYKDAPEEKELTLIPVDVDIDGNNNNATDTPDRSDDEEAKDRLAAGSSPSADDPGKILMANTGDKDSDGVPDFADGLTEFKDDGVKLSSLESDYVEVPDLVPVVLQLDKGDHVTWQDVKVKITYEASAPGGITRTGSAGAYTYAPAEGSLRIWKTNSDGRQFSGDALNPVRNVDSVSSGGDFVDSEEEYTAADLGFTEDKTEINLYLEAIKVSESVRDQEILIEVDFDGDVGDVGFVQVAKLHPTIIGLQLVKVEEGDVLTDVSNIELSTPSPEVSINALSVNNLDSSSDGDSIIGDINLSGSLTSALSNLISASDGGTIDNVSVYLNGSEEPIGIISNTVSKSTNTNSISSPFPFSATFSDILTNIEFTEGVNVITVEATDPLSGASGITEYSVNVEATYNPGKVPPGVAFPPTQIVETRIETEINLDFDQELSPTEIDAITATIINDDGNVDVVRVLTETGVDTNSFISENGDFQVDVTSITPAGPLVIDRHISVDVRHDNLYPFTDGYVGSHTTFFLGDTAKISIIYETSEVITDISSLAEYGYTVYDITSETPELTKESNPGVLNAFLTELKGPKDLLATIESIDIGEEARTALEFGNNARYFVKSLTSPIPQINVFQAWKIASNEDLSTEEKTLEVLQLLAADLTDELKFRLGFAHGVLDGGIDTVIGLKDLVVSAGKLVINTSAPKLIVRFASGDTFEEERRAAAAAATTARQLGEFMWQVNQDLTGSTLAMLLEYNGYDDEAAMLYSQTGDSHMELLSIAAELIVALMEEYNRSDKQEQGYYCGRAAFEIATLFIGWTKLGQVGKLTKLNFLTELQKIPFFAAGGKGAPAFANISALIQKLTTTKMCFVAGTLVMTADGMIPIEQIRPGDIVWSKCEFTQVEDWKPVVDTFVTHPSELIHLAVDYDGDYKADDTIVGTGEHPFYLTNREKKGFFEMRALKRYDQLVLARGKSAQVLSL